LLQMQLGQKTGKNSGEKKRGGRVAPESTGEKSPFAFLDKIGSETGAFGPKTEKAGVGGRVVNGEQESMGQKKKRKRRGRRSIGRRPSRNRIKEMTFFTGGGKT